MIPVLPISTKILLLIIDACKITTIAYTKEVLLPFHSVSWKKNDMCEVCVKYDEL
jgi:hypothetical protein